MKKLITHVLLCTSIFSGENNNVRAIQSLKELVFKHTKNIFLNAASTDHSGNKKQSYLAQAASVLPADLLEETVFSWSKEIIPAQSLTTTDGHRVLYDQGRNILVKDIKGNEIGSIAKPANPTGKPIYYSCQNGDIFAFSDPFKRMYRASPEGFSEDPSYSIESIPNNCGQLREQSIMESSFLLSKYTPNEHSLFYALHTIKDGALKQSRTLVIDPHYITDESTYFCLISEGKILPYFVSETDFQSTLFMLNDEDKCIRCHNFEKLVMSHWCAFLPKTNQLAILDEDNTFYLFQNLEPSLAKKEVFSTHLEIPKGAARLFMIDDNLYMRVIVENTSENRCETHLYSFSLKNPENILCNHLFSWQSKMNFIKPSLHKTILIEDKKNREKVEIIDLNNFIFFCNFLTSLKNK